MTLAKVIQEEKCSSYFHGDFSSIFSFSATNGSLRAKRKSLFFDNMVYYYVTLYSHHYLKEVTINHLLVIVLQAQ